MDKVRIQTHSYFQTFAEVASLRSTCKRAQVGAVLVENNQIRSTGYNGAPSNLPHCLDEGCLLLNGHCRRCIHAEMNAILQVHANVKGMNIYTTHLPCYECVKILIQVRIANVYYFRRYIDATCTELEVLDQISLLESANIGVYHTIPRRMLHEEDK